DKHPFKDSAHRQKELCRFVNFYNTVKPHKSLKGDTPFEVLQASFPTCCVNNPTISYSCICVFRRPVVSAQVFKRRCSAQSERCFR
ncbi:integrase core domain-containing protein, partial [Neisseria dentiae]|nr:integrase core domain-containing protein [Neisseria dentiae]